MFGVRDLSRLDARAWRGGREVPADAYHLVPRSRGLVLGGKLKRNMWGHFTWGEETSPVYVIKGWNYFDAKEERFRGIGLRHILPHNPDFERDTVFNDWQEAVEQGLDRYERVRKRKKLLAGSKVVNEETGDEFTLTPEGEKIRLTWFNPQWREQGYNSPIRIVFLPYENTRLVVR